MSPLTIVCLNIHVQTIVASLDFQKVYFEI